MKYVIDGIEFKSQKSAQEYAKRILYSGASGTCLNEDEKRFMVEYFKRFHRNFKQKQGLSIAEIYRIKDAVGGIHNCFEILRSDGTQTDISYIISKIKKENVRVQFYQALRHAVKDQILEFKKLVFSRSKTTRCIRCRSEINWNDCHIDHFVLPFKVIADRFICDLRITDFKPLIKERTDGARTYELKDISIKYTFSNYHFAAAKLRPLCAKCNLTRNPE